MDATALIALFTSVVVTFFVIMDPLGTVPIFIALTRKEKIKKQQQLALQAVLISIFALFGNQILGFLDISLPSLQASGGLLLLLVALELLTGKDAEPAKTGDVSVALVPLGTPLLAGPGAIAATIIFVRQSQSVADFVTILLGLVVVHIILYLFLRFSIPVMRIVGRGGITVATKLAGLLLAAIAVRRYDFLTKHR
jgi:multiple antibiotic resistance protein